MFVVLVIRSRQTILGSPDYDPYSYEADGRWKVAAPWKFKLTVSEEAENAMPREKNRRRRRRQVDGWMNGCI